MEGIKQKQQQTWATGDFSKVGVEVTIVGERLCEFVKVHAGDRVLDVATGSGNTALAAARRGCVVTGVDYVDALLERARQRAAAEQLTVDFRHGDAEELPFPDASFDVVLTTFGAMFAPDPGKTASELARVCRPGGKIGMANWTPEGMTGRNFLLNAKYVPPPPGVPPPVQWGSEDMVRQRFAPYAKSISADRQYVYFRALSPDHWLAHLRTFFGPSIRTFGQLSPDDQTKLASELTQLAASYNKADNGTLLAEAEYLQVRVDRA